MISIAQTLEVLINIDIGAIDPITTMSTTLLNVKSNPTQSRLKKGIHIKMISTTKPTTLDYHK